MGGFLSNLKSGASPWREDDEGPNEEEGAAEPKKPKKKSPLSPFVIPVAVAIGSVFSPSKTLAAPPPRPGILAPSSSEAQEILPAGSRVMNIKFKVSGPIVGNEWRARKNLEIGAESSEGGHSRTQEIKLDDRTHPHGTPPIHLSVSGDALTSVQGKALKISLEGERNPGNLFEGEVTLEIPFGLLQASSLKHLQGTSTGTLTKADIDALFSSTGLANTPGAEQLRELLKGATYKSNLTGEKEKTGKFGGTVVLTATITSRGSDLDPVLRKFAEVFQEGPALGPSRASAEPLRGPEESPELGATLDMWGVLSQESTTMSDPFNDEIISNYLAFSPEPAPFALRNPDIAGITFQVSDSLEGHFYQIILRVTKKTGETLVFVTRNGLSVTGNPQEAKFERVTAGKAPPAATENPELPYRPPAETPGEFEKDRVPRRKTEAPAKAGAPPETAAKAAPPKAVPEFSTTQVSYPVTGKFESNGLVLTIGAQAEALKKLMNDDSQRITIPIATSNELMAALAKGAQVQGSLDGALNKEGVLEPILRIIITQKNLKGIAFANIANLFDLLGLPAEAFPDGYIRIEKKLTPKELLTEVTSGSGKKRVTQKEIIAVALLKTSPIRNPDVTISVQGDKFKKKGKKGKPPANLFSGAIELKIANLGMAPNADIHSALAELKRLMRQETSPPPPPPSAPSPPAP